jgi:UDP-glucose 4-epimerase
MDHSVPGNKPKVLVTGGAGFIGSHIVDLLIANGYKTVVIDNLSTGSAANLNPGATFYKVDIRDPDISTIFEKERPDYIIHHAARFCDGTSMDQTVGEADANILGSINLIENARRNKVKLFIFASSGQDVYGEPLYLPCDEAHPIQPVCPNGESKYTIEQYLNLYHQSYEIDYIVLRYPNIYGPRQHPNDGTCLIPPLIRKMLYGVQVVINQPNDQREDYVYVTDCAWANLLFLENEAHTGIYNLSAGHSIPISTIITFLKEFINYPYTPVMNFMIESKTREIYLDSRKIQRDYGWKPKVDLLEGVERTVAYFRKMMK